MLKARRSAPGACAIGPIEHLRELPWDDLPRDAVAILQPAADAVLAATLDEGIPEAIDLALVGAVDAERDGLGEGEVRPAVEADELLAGDVEVDRQDLPLSGARVVGRCAVNLLDAAVRQDRGVELGGVQRLSVEPQAWGDLGHADTSWAC